MSPANRLNIRSHHLFDQSQAAKEEMNSQKQEQEQEQAKEVEEARFNSSEAEWVIDRTNVINGSTSRTPPVQQKRGTNAIHSASVAQSYQEILA